MRKDSRRKPKQRRSREIVESILTASLKVFENTNFDSLSTNKIAERAGVSIGSLYQYFSDKESLVSEMLNRQAEEHLRLFEELFEKNRGIEFREMLSRFTDFWIAHFSQNRGYIKNFLESYVRLRRADDLIQLRLKFAKLMARLLYSEYPELGSLEQLERRSFVQLNMSMGLLALLASSKDTFLTPDEIKEELVRVGYNYFQGK